MTYPIMQRNTQNMETKEVERDVWKSITDQFNGENGNEKRTTKQLKEVWKLIKKEGKLYQASTRQEDFKDTGAPLTHSLVETDQQEPISRGMDRVNNEQIPLASVSVNYASFTGDRDMQDRMEVQDSHPQNGTQQPLLLQTDSWPSASTELMIGQQFVGHNLEALEEECHAARMVHLKEELVLKMKIYEEELKYWQRMKCRVVQYSQALEETCEQKTNQMVSTVIRRL